MWPENFLPPNSLIRPHRVLRAAYDDYGTRRGCAFQGANFSSCPWGGPPRVSESQSRTIRLRPRSKSSGLTAHQSGCGPGAFITFCGPTQVIPDVPGQTPWPDCVAWLRVAPCSRDSDFPRIFCLSPACVSDHVDAVGSPHPMPRTTLSRPLTRPETPRTYEDLKRFVEAAFISCQREADRAKLATDWTTGALIDRYLARRPEETGHGTQTMHRLARDSDFEESVIYRCLRFARVYPNFAGRRNLVWPTSSSAPPTRSRCF